MLSAALPIVCKRKSKAQKRPGLVIHGSIAKGDGQERHIMKQIKEITDQNSVVFIIKG